MGRVRATIAPPSAGLGRAQGSVPTIAGPVQVSWRRGNGGGSGRGRGGSGSGSGSGMTMALTVPPNAEATVRLPASGPSNVREGAVAAARAPGVTVVSSADGVVELSVGSGTYRFTST